MSNGFPQMESGVELRLLARTWSPNLEDSEDVGDFYLHINHDNEKSLGIRSVSSGGSLPCLACRTEKLRI
jgi:hypothetical protein